MAEVVKFIFHQFLLDRGDPRTRPTQFIGKEIGRTTGFMSYLEVEIGCKIVLDLCIGAGWFLICRALASRHSYNIWDQRPHSS